MKWLSYKCLTDIHWCLLNVNLLITEFPTSRLEMGTVADIFDRNQDGYIDYQEFIAALRPDWERKGPLTDAERIDDEVQKQVSKCTCRQKFRVHQVGEGKYRVSYFIKDIYSCVDTDIFSFIIFAFLCI